MLSGPILKGKDMCAIFQKKGKKRATNLKKGQKMYKIWKYWKKGRRFCVIIAHNKLLE